MRWDGMDNVSRLEKMKNANTILSETLYRIDGLGDQRVVGRIEIDLKEMLYESVDWINLPQERVRS
jgi:hypothetical protein